MSKRVVITGLGILTSNGKGRQEFWQSLKDGKVGYKPITLFDPAQFRVNQAGEISDFNAKDYFGPKGLRNLDRSTRLLVAASKLAVADSQFEITDENTEEVGVSVGTTLGSIKSIVEFDEVTLREGPRYVNPALFPNTVINSPASQVSIWNNIQAFNSTISTGFTASLDAMQYAYDFIQWDRAKVVFTGGVEEMCIQTFLGFHTLKFLSGSKEDESFVNCPFDKRRNGVTLGEGACLMAMEEYDHARSRNAPMLAEVLSFGYSFDPYRLSKYNPRGIGIKKAMKEALDNAGLKPQDIDYICSDANSTQAADKIETEAIKEIFGDYSRKVPVSAVKSMVGECYSVSGAFNMAAGLGAINEGFIPPTVNYQEPDPDCDLDYVPNQSRKADIKTVLVINFSPSGSNTCIVLRKVE
ncbi:MAG: beta-ketoacyl-[acyl-carrier-protein] synthase family protein [Candidatus Omnitrophica bacterium]|nr:beta-ketoacyl-[acyl-carrier-protein] synthase family protein [Candidatus Omnitrophota bacterium]